MICKICNKEFKSVKGLCSHIMQIHKEISLLQYYELFLWSKTYCKICENKPKFIMIYYKFIFNLTDIFYFLLLLKFISCLIVDLISIDFYDVHII